MESEGFTEASSSSATPKRSGSKLSPLTNQRIERMKAKINSLKCKIFRRKVPHCFCKGRPIEATNRTNISRLICESKRYLSKDAHIIFANELKANFVNKFNRRYDDDLKEMCLLWYYASPKGYKALSKSLNLPTVRSLRNWQAKLKISPGISPAIEESLKIHFKNCTDQKRKICILIFDEISLSEEIHYNRATDRVIGVVDTGNIRRNEKATSALVCMVRGIVYNWKFTLGYWFLGRTATNEFLPSIFSDSLDSAFKAGLIVKAVVCDQSPVNQNVARQLKISVNQSCFFRNDEKIFFLFDAPHLLKSVRNNLAKYDLIYKNKTVRWKYIESAGKSSNPLRVRLLPKLTEEHFNVTSFNAMRVKYATQVLSESVSVAMLVLQQFGELPADSLATAEFVSDMDKLFDCLNSSKLDTDLLKMRYAMSDGSPHEKFISEIRDNFKNSRFLLSKRSIPPCINGFIITINSVLQLAEDLRLNYGVAKLLTRHLNQDPVENLFATVRQQHGCCRNPSSLQFENGLRHTYLTSISKLSSQTNCEDDFSFSLKKLSELSELSESQINSQPEASLSWKAIDNIDVDLQDENAIYYVSGYMAKKFLKLHPCEKCKSLLVDDEKKLTGQHQLFTYFKQGESLPESEGLLYASQSFYEYIKKLEVIHNVHFKDLLHSRHIVGDLVEIVRGKNEISFDLCTPEASGHFLKMFMTTRCLWGVRFENQNKIKKVNTKNQKLRNVCNE